MSFVLSRRLEVKPWELEAAIEDAIDVSKQFAKATGLAAAVLEPIGGDVVGALWVILFAPDLAALAKSSDALAGLTPIRAQLNQLWQQRLNGPITEYLHEVVRGKIDASTTPHPYYGITRSFAPATDAGEALSLAFDYADLVAHHARERVLVTTGYTGPWLEAVTTVGHAAIEDAERTRRDLAADPAMATILKRAAALDIANEVLLLRRRW